MNAQTAQRITSNPSPALTVPWFGVQAHDLTNAFREQFGIAAFSGVAVSSVAANSPAQQAGIRAGDAIIEIAGRPLDSAAELHAWVEQSRPGDSAQVIFYRGISRMNGRIVLGNLPQNNSPVISNRPRPNQLPANSLPGTIDPATGLPGSTPSVSGPSSAPANGAANQSLPAGTEMASPPSMAAKAPLPNVLPTAPGQPASNKSASPPPIVAAGPSARELQLEAEVKRLSSELATAQAKLAETKQQLDSILRSLKN
jgi:membrane-associated protease RseP (regulator of RpoE activity)